MSAKGDRNPYRFRSFSNLVPGVILLLATGLLLVASHAASASPTPGARAGGTNPATPPPPCTLQFRDVPFGSTFYPYVRYLSCSSILSGYADGTFRPNNNITRGQLSKIVSNSAGFDDRPGAQSFEDVPPGSTFYDWIQRLSGRGYISGYPCGGPGEPCISGKPYFRPNANATRGQISKIVSNAKGFNDQPTGQTFQDVPPNSTFYVWVERLASRGVMSGYPCGGPGEPCGSGNSAYFRPNRNATRGQVSKIVANTFFPNAYPTQSMIGDAERLGLIDYGTSVLYRAYALFGDRHLPAEYIGTGSSGEDAGVFYEATVPTNTIPPDIRAQLQPYIVRPDDPDSIFHDQLPPTATPTSGPLQGNNNSAGMPSSAPGVDVFCDSHGWAALESAPQHFKAWARCDPSHLSADPDTVRVLTSTLELADTIWGPMTTLMGTPVPDEGGEHGGGDSAIDIYVVDPLDLHTADGRSLEMTEGRLAAAPSAPPLQGRTSSGYIVISRTGMSRGLEWRDDLVHEFFHSLQDAHNQQVQFRTDGTEYWFTEASATWATAYFDRTITNWPRRWAGRYADRDVFSRFYDFQWKSSANLSLNLSVPIADPNDKHMYEAFIWPFFMEQETGGPTAVANAWHGMESATDWNAADDAVGAQLPFPDNFHRFAIRNVNSNFDGQNPIGTHYKDLDTLFVDNVGPLKEDHTLPASQPSDPPQQFDVQSIQPLNARYFSFEPDTSDLGSVQKWEFDFSQLQSSDDFDVDALLKHTNGTWELRSNIAKSGVVGFCDVQLLWMIVSNHDRSTQVSGSFTAKALTTPCTCQLLQPYIGQPWSASYDLTYSKTGEKTDDTGYTRVTVDHSYQVGGTLSNWAGSWVTGTLTTGTGSINDERYHRDPNGVETTSTFIGSGPPVIYDQNGLGPYSTGDLAIRLDTCTYSIRQQIAVNAIQEPGHESVTEPIGMVAIDDIPIGQSTILAGSMTLPVRWASSEIPFYKAGGYDIYLLGILGEGNMGTAQFNWSFTPQGAPTPPARLPNK